MQIDPGTMPDGWAWATRILTVAIALWAIRRLIDEELPWLERRAVRLARQDGASWASIARVLRRSRQSVHRKFAGDER